MDHERHAAPLCYSMRLEELLLGEPLLPSVLLATGTLRQLPMLVLLGDAAAICRREFPPFSGGTCTRGCPNAKFLLPRGRLAKSADRHDQNCCVVVSTWPTDGGAPERCRRADTGAALNFTREWRVIDATQPQIGGMPFSGSTRTEPTDSKSPMDLSCGGRATRFVIRS